MIVSRKRLPFLPSTELNINNNAMSRVDHFKYLGVWLSHNLSWNKHVEVTCKSATKKLGLAFRKFYKHSSPAALKQLYLSYVRSQLEYASPVWDPHYSTLISALEKVQKFALRICTRNWNSDYTNLLRDCNLPALSTRRLYLKLCFLHQVINENFVFPYAPLTRRNIPLNLRNSDSLQFERPLVQTNAYKYSFFPHTIATWNTLPSDIQLCTSLWSFKRYLLPHLSST